MRYGVSHRWTLVVLGVVSIGLLGWPPPGSAQIPGLIGSGTTTALVDTGPCQGPGDARDASLLAPVIPTLGSGDALHAATICYSDEVDSEASMADLAVGIAGNTISANFIMAQATSVLNGAPIGTAEVDSLSINGVPVVVTGVPNQTVAIPGGQVVIGEVQSSPDGVGTVVNALHVTVDGVANVVIASATADAQTVTGEGTAVQATY